MAAADNIKNAQYALATIADLIVVEAQNEADDDGDTDATDDLVNLRAAADSLNAYVAATTQEVGTADDLEDVADDMNARVRASMGYGPDF